MPLGDEAPVERARPSGLRPHRDNAMVWLIQLSPETFTNGYATVPYEITHGTDLIGIFDVRAGGQVFPIPISTIVHQCTSPC